MSMHCSHELPRFMAHREQINMPFLHQRKKTTKSVSSNLTEHMNNQSREDKAVKSFCLPSGVAVVAYWLLTSVPARAQSASDCMARAVTGDRV